MTEYNIDRMLIDSFRGLVERKIKHESRILDQFIAEALAEILRKTIKIRGREIKDRIKDIAENVVDSLMEDQSYEEELKAALRRRMANVLVAEMGLPVEAKVNELRANPQFRKKLSEGIEKLLEQITSDLGSNGKQDDGKQFA